MHLEGQKVGNVLCVPQEKVKGVQKIIEKVKNFSLYVIASPAASSMFKDAQVLKSQNEYYGDKIDNHYTFLWNQVLGFLGISSIADKKSGVNVMETKADAGISKVNRNAILLPRRQAIDRINKMFDLNISVDFVDTEEEVNENEQIYNDLETSNGGSERTESI